MVALQDRSVEGFAGPGVCGSPAAGAGEAGPLGLSLSHTWPDVEIPVGKFGLRIAEGGRCCRIRESMPPRPSPFPDKKRGQVRGFSAGSRSRMLEFLQCVDRAKVAGLYFGTLTIPAGRQCTWAQAEAYRRAWVKRFRRRWGSSGWFMVWRKEAHSSGLPHLHFILFWLGHVPHLVNQFRPWNDDAWAEVIGTAVTSSVRTECRVELLKSWNGATMYCAKYMAKVDEQKLPARTGRMWGVENRKLVPRRISFLGLEHKPGCQVRRQLRKYRARCSRRWKVHVPGQGWKFLQPGEAGDSMAGAARRAGYKVRQVRVRGLVTIRSGSGPARDMVTPDFEILRAVGPGSVRAVTGGLFYIDPALVWRVVRCFSDGCTIDYSTGELL